MRCGSHKVEVSERMTGMAHDIDVMSSAFFDVPPSSRTFLSANIQTFGHSLDDYLCRMFALARIFGKYEH